MTHRKERKALVLLIIIMFVIIIIMKCHCVIHTLTQHDLLDHHDGIVSDTR